MFPVRGPTKDCGISHSCPAPLSSQSNGTQMREAPGRDERERLGQSDRKYREDQRDNQIPEIRSGYTQAVYCIHNINNTSSLTIPTAILCIR